jgi:ATP-binding cassette, subfamily B, bacterial
MAIPTTTDPKTEKNSLRIQMQALRYLPPFMRMIWEVSPRMAIINMLTRLVWAAVPVAMLYVGKLIIDEVIAEALVWQKTGAWPQQPRIWTLVGIEFGLVLLSDVLSRISMLSDSLLGDLVNNDSSVRIIKHAATLDLYQFEDPKFYDKLERARTQTAGRTALLSLCLSMAQDVVTILFLAIGLVAVNPWLLLILALSVIPSFFGEARFNYESYSLTRSWTPERRELDYLRYIGASDTTAKEIKIFGLENFLADRYKTLSHTYFLAARSLAIRRAAVGLLFALLTTLAYYGAYVFILMQAVKGLITVGTLTFLSGSFSKMQGTLQSLVNRFTRVGEMSLYLQDLFDFLDMQPNARLRAGDTLVPQPVKAGFVFEGVGFKYPGSEMWAVRNLSFTLAAGEKLALVGENGAGKTTLVKLLARLYEPTEGRILLDGKPINDYQYEDYRKSVGIIFQDYVRFMFTARENIAIGEIDARQNLPAIQSAAQKSLADQVIEGLPGGYDQVLGKRFEKGVELSGGQWQKVALARAYMKDAQLVILDEPTSALDARAEHEVFVRFSELMRGKSGVLISHRFSTVRIADRILFLEHGQLLELGTHDELLLQNGKYAELFRLQAKGYV